MKLSKKNAVWQAVSLGALAGMRTFSAPAIISHVLSHSHPRNLGNSRLRFMQNVMVANAFKVLAVGELIGDKMPDTPNGINPMGVTGRVAAGMLTGASIYKAAGGKAAKGAFIGGVSALASTFASFYLRREIVKNTKVKDPIIGLLEDALVIGSGIMVAAKV